MDFSKLTKREKELFIEAWQYRLGAPSVENEEELEKLNDEKRDIMWFEFPNEGTFRKCINQDIIEVFKKLDFNYAYDPFYSGDELRITILKSNDSSNDYIKVDEIIRKLDILVKNRDEENALIKEHEKVLTKYSNSDEILEKLKDENLEELLNNIIINNKEELIEYFNSLDIGINMETVDCKYGHYLYFDRCSSNKAVDRAIKYLTTPGYYDMDLYEIGGLGGEVFNVFFEKYLAFKPNSKYKDYYPMTCYKIKDYISYKDFTNKLSKVSIPEDLFNILYLIIGYDNYIFEDDNCCGVRFNGEDYEDDNNNEEDY